LDWINKQMSLVMLSDGGNDAHFGEVLRNCYLFVDHVRVKSCEQLYEKRVHRWITEIKQDGRLDNLYLDIKAKAAPGAKILVNTYPRFFTIRPRRSCDLGSGMWMSVSDQLWLNSNILWLDQIITKAAKSAGVTVVDEYDAFDGHELCSAQPWMHEVQLDLLDKSWQSESFHPNALGYRAFAKRNLQKLGAQL
jgi:lysophospholipase L1-like esterase